MTEPLNRIWVSQPPRDACQRIERIAWGLRRKKKQEDDIHRLAVNRIEVDGVPEANQCAEGLLQIRHPRMRDRHAVACAGGSQVFAFQQLHGYKLGVQVYGGG